MEEIVKKVRELHELLKGTKYHVRVCSKFLQVTVGDHCKRKKAIQKFKEQVELCNYEDKYGGRLELNVHYKNLIDSMSEKKKNNFKIIPVGGLSKEFDKEEGR